MGCFLFEACVLGLCFLRVCGLFAFGVESDSFVAEFCEPFKLSVVRVRERSVHSLRFRCWVSLCHWPVFCASSWYMFSMVMMWSAALSILVGVTVGEAVSLARYVDASRWALLVLASPSW